MLGLPPWCNRGIGSITAASQQRAEGAQVRQAGSTHFLRNIMHYCTFNAKYDHLTWCGRDLTLFLDYSSHGIIAVYWDLEGFWLKRSPGALVQGSIVFIFFFRMIRITGRSRTIQAASVEPEPNIPLSAVTQLWNASLWSTILRSPYCLFTQSLWLIGWYFWSFMTWGGWQQGNQ